MTKLVLIEGGAAKAPEPMPAELYVVRVEDKENALCVFVADTDPAEASDAAAAPWLMGEGAVVREPARYVRADDYTVERMIDLKMRLLDLRAALAGSRDATSQTAREALVTRALEADFENEKGGA